MGKLKRPKYKYFKKDDATGNILAIPYDTYEERPLYMTKNISNAVLYPDRMKSWDNDKYSDCCNKVWNGFRSSFIGCDSEEINEFINLYLGHSVELTGVLINIGYDGYDYYCFQYFDETIEKKEDNI